MRLERADFDRLRQSIHRLCGLVIGDDKEYLVRDRLAPIIARNGWNSYAQLADRLQSGAISKLTDEVVEAIVTRETSFFRDPHVWESIRRDLFPKLLESRSPSEKVRLWSAAASAGQEAYTLAMLVHEAADSQLSPRASPERFSILATDICPTAVAAGQQGVYDARELARGVTELRKRRFFEAYDGRWRVREELRKLVEFRRVNLAHPLPRLGTFDLICCRNVLIYFDEATRRQVCAQFHGLLANGGWLLLGSAENLYGISDRFESVQFGEAIAYRKT
jgi:chemotaxis protein methyltransferase CheR